MDDGIDAALGKLINEYPERSKLKVMFKREKEGVYQFGKKRVAISVKNKKVMIRIGAGFIPVYEFIETYTQKEYEKIDDISLFMQQRAANKNS